MARYIVQKLLQLVFLLVAVSAIIFFLLRLGPFDPAKLIQQASLADPARIAELRREWGLDKPVPVQYLDYMWHVLHGNFGRSFQSNEPVSVEISQRLPATAAIGLLALVAGTGLGLLFGVLAAYLEGSFMDLASRSIALVGVSFPPFLLGIMAVSLFAVKLHWLPAGGQLASGVTIHNWTGFVVLDGLLQGRWSAAWNGFEHLILPAGVLSLLVAGLVTRITRAGMLEALTGDYVRTAVAKGDSRWRAATRHALPNALLPIVTIVGLECGLLLSGSTIIETVFAYPGMGQYLINSISTRDLPAIQASILLLATIYVVVNALVDIVYAIVDPRIHLQ
jgi:peptide/nickel transport system permease protein